MLLAECYLGKYQIYLFFVGEGKAYKAYEVLKDSTQMSNRYKLALTCMRLNKF